MATLLLDTPPASPRLRRRTVLPPSEQEDAGELLFNIRKHSTVVAWAFGAAFVLLATGVVTSLGIALLNDECSTSSFSRASVGVTLAIISALTLLVFAIVFVNVERHVHGRSRARNVIFLLTIGLMLTGQWFKWSTAVVLGCPATVWSVLNLVAAVLLLVWFVAIIWSPSLTY